MFSIFNSIFMDLKPHSSFYTKEIDISTDPGLLFLLSSLDHERIDFNANHILNNILLPKAFSDINVIGNFFVIYRGLGTGKTSALDTIRQEAMKTDGIFVLAITYNYKWENEHDWETTDPRVFFNLSFLSRLVSIFYGIGFDGAISLVVKCLQFIDSLNVSTSEHIVRSFVTYCITILNKKLQKQSKMLIHTILFLADETVKIQDYMEKYYRIKYDVTSNIRKIFYNQQLIVDGFAIKRSIVISTLDTKTLGISDSGKQIIFFPLPERLNVNDVLKKWWNQLNYFKLSTDLFKLRMVISSLNNLPRMLEIGPIVIQYCIDSNIINVTQEVMKKFFDAAKEKLTIQYKMLIQPSDDLVYKMVFGHTVRLSDIEVGKLIRKSYFLNNLQKLTEDTFFVPESNMYMIYCCAQETRGSNYLARVIFDSLDNIFKKFTKCKVGEYFLEVICLNMLRIRIATAASNPQYVCNLSLLLGKLLMNDLPKKITYFLNTDILLPSSDKNVEVYQMKIDSYGRKNKEEFLKELKIIKSKLTIEKPIIIIVGAQSVANDGKAVNDDAFDLGIVGLFSNQKPYLILMDSKAGNVEEVSELNEESDRKLPISMRDKKEGNEGNEGKEGKQFFHMNSVFNKSKVFNIYNHINETNEPNECDYLYVYVTTSNGESFHQDGALVLKSHQVHSFLSFALETYLTAKSVL